MVLIGEHNPEGALGVVLNRSLDVTVEDAVPELAALVPPGDRLYQGGPVQPASPVLLADFVDPTVADLLIFDSIGFVMGIPVDLEENLRQARLFAGYSGWGPGQLEAEMAEEAWILEPATAADVFTSNPELLWSRVLHRKGDEFRRLSRVPFDPSMN